MNKHTYWYVTWQLINSAANVVAQSKIPVDAKSCTFLANFYTPPWSPEFFVIKEVAVNVLRAYVIEDFNVGEIIRMFKNDFKKQIIRI